MIEPPGSENATRQGGALLTDYDVTTVSQAERRVNGKITMPCPACREAGKDTAGDNLTVFPSGKFHCIAAGKDKAHNRRIIELMPELGSAKPFPSSGPCLAARPRSAPKPVDLLSRIKAGYPATVADLWESSPVRCDDDLDDAKVFLQLFPSRGILWISPDIFQSGKPEHARFFRTREQWEAETFTTPGTRIAPASFKAGSYSRNRESVADHLFAVVESDEIGEGKLYASKDEFCSLIRWLREACSWHLAAVVDSGNRSLHAWFRHPGSVDMRRLAEHSTALGLDAKFAEPSQPWRLPGVRRENSEQSQILCYFDPEIVP
jgi:hypothetical protein